MRYEIEEFAAKRIDMPDMAASLRELIAIGLRHSQGGKRKSQLTEK